MIVGLSSLNNALVIHGNKICCVEVIELSAVCDSRILDQLGSRTNPE